MSKISESIRPKDKYKSYLRQETLDQHIEKMVEIATTIDKRLSDYPNFDGIDFSDVSTGYIQIRGHHKMIEKYSYGGQPDINLDFSNYKEAIDEFVGMWKRIDNEESVNSELKFISCGEKWGWD